MTAGRNELLVRQENTKFGERIFFFAVTIHSVSANASYFDIILYNYNIGVYIVL